jgi:hypothetical protein
MRERFPEKTHIQNAQKISRRSFVGGAVGSAAVLGWATKVGIDYRNEQTGIEPEVEEVAVEEEVPSVEMIAEDLDSPVFDRVLKAREIQFGGLRRDQVLFIDSFGRQITEVWPLTESVGLAPEEMTWRYQGGGPAGIPGTWTKQQEAYISEQLGIPTAEIGMLHVYQDLAKTNQEHMQSQIESVYQNAVNPGEGGESVVSILQRECKFQNIPPHIAAMLEPAMTGIAAEESRFTQTKVSPAGATGVLQIMPKVAAKYAENNHLENFDISDLSNQILVAVDHVETCYRLLTKNLKEELAYFTEQYFNGNTASMEKYLLVPLILNSYNVGQNRMIEVVEWFADAYFEPKDASEIFDTKAPLSGYDLYQAMVYAADEKDAVKKFGDDSSNYVEKVMGWQRAFETYEVQQLVTQLASN